MKKTKHTERRHTFWGVLSRFRRSLAALLPPDPPTSIFDLAGLSPQTKVLHILHEGQKVPIEWKEQVPSNIVLIAIVGEAGQEHNCFLARPVPLEHLKKALTPGVSIDNTQPLTQPLADSHCHQASRISGP